MNDYPRIIRRHGLKDGLIKGRTPTRVLFRLCAAALLLSAGAAYSADPSATNGIPEPALNATAENLAEAAFRHALIAEEGNQDLEAAIRGYQQVIIHLDAQRRLQATAIFRLAECYRKLGLTNEAVAQYSRVLRDFSEQATLVTRSREDLLALQVQPADQGVDRNPAPASQPPTVESTNAAALPAGAIALDEEQREIRRLQAMLRNSPDLLEAPGADGERPLAGAAARGQWKVVQFLLESGAQVSARSLALAVLNGHRSIVDLLLDHGVDANAHDGGTPPLHRAAIRGFKAVAESLLAHGAEVDGLNSLGETPLHLAAAQGNDDILGLLLSKSANINAQDANGKTPLSRAIVESRESSVRTLLQHGADANVAVAGEKQPRTGPAQTGDYPLHLAVTFSSRAASLVDLLLQAGANPQVLSPGPRSGATPLRLALAENRLEAAHLLLRASADPTFPGSYNVSELGTLFGDPELFREMVATGADVNAPTADKMWTLLHLAAAGGYRQIVEILLEHGADPNSEAGTPLRGHPVSRTMTIGEAEIRITDGDTPLHGATRRMAEDIVKLLLDHGADPNVLNSNEETPLFLTVNVGGPGNEASQKIEALLRQHGALDDVPRLDRIQISRPSTGVLRTLFTRGSHDFNTFSLFELIALQYGLVSTDVAATGGPATGIATPGANLNRMGARAQGPRAQHGGAFDFPNFSQVRIRRSMPGGRGWADPMLVDLSGSFESGECGADVPLRWGDVVEIPEIDHPLNATWQGLSLPTLRTLRACLTREIEIVVKGQSTKVTLAPGVVIQDERVVYASSSRPFTIVPVLVGSDLLLTSSDLSRVRVERRMPDSGEVQTWLLDCTPNPLPDFWLRDGDRIEVPDKP